ncbi:MAG: transcription initiation factor IIB family protein [Candidatus Bathyarchaeota archaeon]
MHLLKCPECGSSEIGFNQQLGETICRDCGLVIEDNLVSHEEYMSEPAKKNASHPFLACAGTKEIHGRIVKHSWLLSTKEKNLRYGNNRIEALGGKLSLSDRVVDEAKMLFKRSMTQDLAVGRDFISLAYACVYSACIIHGVPKTLLELTIHTSLTKKKVLSAFRLLKKELELHMEPIDPYDLIPRFASKLQLSHQTKTLAIEMMTKLKECGLTSGKRPETVIAGVLYLASKKNNEPRTQRDVANAVGVIEITIRKFVQHVSSKAF